MGGNVSIARIFEHGGAALTDLPTLLFKLRHRRMVSFRFCSALRQFARSPSVPEVGCVIDVGANEGQFACMARFCWPAARIESFEPDPDAARRFRENHRGDSNIQFQEHALGTNSGLLKLRLGATSAQNSVFAEMGKESPGILEVRVERLDEACRIEPNTETLLKIDVQGYELPVLAGAERVLPLLRYVLVEVSLADLFEGGTRLEEVWSFLRARGFVYQRILDTYCDPATGVALQLDVIFTRTQ